MTMTPARRCKKQAGVYRYFRRRFRASLQRSQQCHISLSKRPRGRARRFIGRCAPLAVSSHASLRRWRHFAAASADGHSRSMTMPEYFDWLSRFGRGHRASASESTRRDAPADSKRLISASRRRWASAACEPCLRSRRICKIFLSRRVARAEVARCPHIYGEALMKGRREHTLLRRAAWAGAHGLSRVLDLTPPRYSKLATRRHYRRASRVKPCCAQQARAPAQRFANGMAADRSLSRFFRQCRRD